MSNIFRALAYQRWALLWTAFILILCTAKMPDTGSSGIFFAGFDKLVHLGFFYVLTILIMFGKIRQQQGYGFSVMTMVKMIVLTFILGGSIELIQLEFFPYRSAEWWDLGCDMLGVLMGVFSYVILHLKNYNEK